MLVLTVGAVLLAIHSSASLVSLGLLGYAGVAQLFPGVILGLFSRRVTTPGIFAGMATGIAVAAILMLTGRDPYLGLKAGFIALCFNFAVTGVASLLMPIHTGGFDEMMSAIYVCQTERIAGLKFQESKK